MRARIAKASRKVRKPRRKVSRQDSSLSFPLKVSPAPPTGPADRQCARIILVSGGTGSFEAGRRTQEVSMGHVVIVSPGYSVRCVRPENLQMRVVSVEVPAFRAEARHWDIARSANFKALFPFAASRAPQQGAQKLLDFCLISQIFEQLLALAGEIEREIAEQHPGWRDLASLHFQHLCIAASRGYAQQRRTSLDTDRRVARAVEYIDRNFREEITVDALAHAAAMSKRNFYRLFRQTLGLTPNAHLKQVRLTRASEMLRLSEATITEICYDCGFTDSNFFSREFRRTHGMSPTYYRRIWRR
jgi:AraC family L-rhamnose operon transcriptional activator RhaR/AraC family L-rhamnose operon regulatory protein RhaS